MAELAARVLIIDDDLNQCKTLDHILKLKGFRPQSFVQGRPAIAWAAKEMPAAALIDLRLQDIPGLEVLQAIKLASPLTECIVLTGYASEESAIEAIRLGSYSYLQKPVDMEQLLVAVRHAVEKHETDRALIESEQRFRAFMQNFPGLAFMKDGDGHVVFANEGFTRYFDRDPVISVRSQRTRVPTARAAEHLAPGGRRRV